MASRSRPHGKRRWLRYTGVALLVLVALAVVGSFFIDEPLRRVVRPPDEPAAEGVHRGHPQAQLPSDRALADPLRPEVPPGGPSRSARLPRAPAGRQRPVESAPPGAAGRQLRPGAARHLREPPAAPRRGEGSDPGQGPRLAGGVRGDLPPEDQRGPRDGRARDLRRRGALRAARGQPDQAQRREHPEHPVEGADLPVGPPSGRRRVPERPRDPRRACRLPGGADPGRPGRREAGTDRPRLLQAGAEPRQRRHRRAGPCPRRAPSSTAPPSGSPTSRRRRSAG